MDELKNDYGNLSVSQLEEKYECSYGTIQRVLKYNKIISSNTKNIKYTFLNDNLEEFKKDWIENKLSIDKLAEKYNCPIGTLKTKARDFNIKRKSLREKLDINQIINDWNSNEYYSYELCKKYKICKSTLFSILRDNNVADVGKRNGRKYYFNEKYFDEIDDEHKAYWLGFIYADGSHNVNRYSLRICLQISDEYILKQFCYDIECNREIKYSYNKAYKRYYPYIYVQHPHLSKTLLEKGVPGNKSFKIRFPTYEIVPKHLIRHFVRGYYDGDGGVSINNLRKTSFSIAGNYEFMTQLNNYLVRNIDSFTNVNLHKVKKSNIYILARGGRNNVERFLNWIYEDATIFIPRKHEKYKKLLEYNSQENNKNE